MDSKDQIKQLTDRVTRLKDNINTEETTKTSLVLPFLQTLGYDVRLICCMAAWLLCLNCAPKQQFYFTPSTRSINYDQRGQLQNLALSTHQSQAILSPEGTLADSVAFIATALSAAEDLPTNAYSQGLSVAARAKLTPVDKSMGSIRQTVLITKPQRVISKKGVRPSEVKPPVYRLAWLSLLISLTGLALVFSSGSFAASLGLLSLLAGLITGGIAASKIKKEPNRFSGRGFAIASIVIVLVMFVVGIALFISFLGHPLGR